MCDKIESRCGIVCSECEFHANSTCKGCTMIPKPFWGDSCPIKDCCKNKELENCGKCKEFPCDLLNSFAYNEEQGDDGKRIEQCKIWCKCERKEK